MKKKITDRTNKNARRMTNEWIWEWERIKEKYEWVRMKERK